MYRKGGKARRIFELLRKSHSHTNKKKLIPRKRKQKDNYD